MNSVFSYLKDAQSNSVLLSIGKSVQTLNAGDFISLDEHGSAIKSTSGMMVKGISADSYDRKTTMGGISAEKIMVIPIGKVISPNYDRLRNYRMLDRIYINPKGQFTNEYCRPDSFCGYVFETPEEIPTQKPSALGVNFNTFMTPYGLQF